MSVKQQFAQAVAALPESVTVEEAFERLYQAFQAKRERERIAVARERSSDQEAEAEQMPPPSVIEERLRRLSEVTGKLVGPVLPDEALRREGLYEERA